MSSLAALFLILLFAVVMITAFLLVLLLVHLGIAAVQYTRYLWRLARA